MRFLLYWPRRARCQIKRCPSVQLHGARTAVEWTELLTASRNNHAEYWRLSLFEHTNAVNAAQAIISQCAVFGTPRASSSFVAINFQMKQYIWLQRTMQTTRLFCPVLPLE